MARLIPGDGGFFFVLLTLSPSTHSLNRECLQLWDSRETYPTRLRSQWHTSHQARTRPSCFNMHAYDRCMLSQSPFACNPENHGLF